MKAREVRGRRGRRDGGLGRREGHDLGREGHDLGRDGHDLGCDGRRRARGRRPVGGRRGGAREKLKQKIEGDPELWDVLRGEA